MKKKRFIFLVLISVFFGFYKNVQAVNLYECEYSASETKATLTIQADANLSGTVKVVTYKGKRANKKATINYWSSFNQEKSNIPASLWVPKKGCPKYLAIVQEKTTGLEKDSGGKYNVWANWDKEKSNNHCKGKDCIVTTRVGDPKPKISVCYYDNNNKKTSRSNSMIMIFHDDSGYKTWARRTNPKDHAVGGLYSVENSGFYDENVEGHPFTCPSEIYQCKTETSSQRPGGTYTTPTYAVYAVAELRNNNNGCMKNVTDIKEDINEEEAYKKGMAGDEWLDPTEGPTAEECKKNPDQAGCAKNSCEVIDTSGEVFKILKQILGYVQIGSVFAVLIFCILDLGGAVASSDDEAFRKARGKVMKRIIALVLIFLVPLLVNFVINLVNLGACSEEDYDFIGNLFN